MNDTMSIAERDPHLGAVGQHLGEGSEVVPDVGHPEHAPQTRLRWAAAAGSWPSSSSSSSVPSASSLLLSGSAARLGAVGVLGAGQGAFSLQASLTGRSQREADGTADERGVIGG